MALNIAGADIPVPSINVGSSVSWIVTGVLIFLGVAALGFVGWFIFSRMKFNKKIVIFEKINNVFQPTRHDRACFVRFGTGGDRLFYLRRLKKYVPVPEIQTGINTYWFFLREDGELINFSPADFDEQSRKMGAHFLDKEMRYARVSLQGHWKDRYDKPKFWEKYGTLIVNIIFIALILVFFILILDKYFDSINQLNSLLETAGKLQETNMKVLAAIDNVCSGSGIVAT